MVLLSLHRHKLYAVGILRSLQESAYHILKVQVGLRSQKNKKVDITKTDSNKNQSIQKTKADKKQTQTKTKAGKNADTKLKQTKVKADTKTKTDKKLKQERTYHKMLRGE